MQYRFLITVSQNPNKCHRPICVYNSISVRVEKQNFESKERRKETKIQNE